MNERRQATERDDGYTQDPASQWVAEAVGAEPGRRVPTCAPRPAARPPRSPAPGPPSSPPTSARRRVGLVAGERALGSSRRGVCRWWWPTAPPAVRARPRSTACWSTRRARASGALRRRARRPLARSTPTALERLAACRRACSTAAAPLVRPGGTLDYWVCTLTAAETTEVADALRRRHPTGADRVPGEPWRPWGSGALLLPQAAGTDGMAMFRAGRLPDPAPMTVERPRPARPRRLRRQVLDGVRRRGRRHPRGPGGPGAASSALTAAGFDASTAAVVAPTASRPWPQRPARTWPTASPGWSSPPAAPGSGPAT